MTAHDETAVTDVVPARRLKVNTYTIPASSPESDGTLEWSGTTLILVALEAGDKQGIGYTYASHAAAVIIAELLQPVVIGKNVMDIPAVTLGMQRAVRNQGNSGLAMMAVSAVDNALWDLKARLLNLPLATLLGSVRKKIQVYGSGGFTSYTGGQLQQQLEAWVHNGIKQVKIKVGRHAPDDGARVRLAKNTIGDDVSLFVDANGAYTVKEAIEKAYQFADYNVRWFEEPVSSENLDGLCFIRGHVPPAVNIAAGEYGYSLSGFRKMLNAHAVDILQADATRCGGITGFLKAGYLAEAEEIPFSSHGAPTVHVAAGMALPSFCTAEYFHDHVRIESMLFDGFVYPKDGYLQPDSGRPGLGVDFKYKDAEKYRQ